MTKDRENQSVTCTLCGQVFSFKQGTGKDGGTGTLNAHMRTKHMDVWGEQTGSNVGGIQMTIDPRTGRNFKYDKKKERVEIAKMVAYDCLPFSFPSGLGFVTYIQRCYNPLFEGIPRSTCRADVIDLFKKYRFYLRHVFNSLNCNVCLTADLGLSLNKLDFFAITCHWVDDNWVMQKRIIAFLYDEGKGRHDGKFLADSMSTIMRFFNIYRKTLCIALDNASNNTKAVGLLKRELNPPLKNIFHVRCSCHILNLIVKDGLECFEDSIQKVRNAVAFLFCNANRAKLRDFKNSCVENNLDLGKFK